MKKLLLVMLSITLFPILHLNAFDINKISSQATAALKKADEITTKNVPPVISSIKGLVITGIDDKTSFETIIGNIKSSVAAIKNEKDDAKKVALGIDLIGTILEIVQVLNKFVDKTGDSIKIISNNLINPFNTSASSDANTVGNNVKTAAGQTETQVTNIQSIIPELKAAILNIKDAIQQ